MSANDVPACVTKLGSITALEPIFDWCATSELRDAVQQLFVFRDNVINCKKVCQVHLKRVLHLRRRLKPLHDFFHYDLQCFDGFATEAPDATHCGAPFRDRKSWCFMQSTRYRRVACALNRLNGLRDVLVHVRSLLKALCSIARDPPDSGLAQSAGRARATLPLSRFAGSATAHAADSSPLPPRPGPEGAAMCCVELVGAPDGESVTLDDAFFNAGAVCPGHEGVHAGPQDGDRASALRDALIRSGAYKYWRVMRLLGAEVEELEATLATVRCAMEREDKRLSDAAAVLDRLTQGGQVQRHPLVPAGPASSSDSVSPSAPASTSPSASVSPSSAPASATPLAAGGGIGHADYLELRVCAGAEAEGVRLEAVQPFGEAAKEYHKASKCVETLQGIAPALADMVVQLRGLGTATTRAFAAGDSDTNAVFGGRGWQRAMQDAAQEAHDVIGRYAPVMAHEMRLGADAAARDARPCGADAALPAAGEQAALEAMCARKMRRLRDACAAADAAPQCRRCCGRFAPFLFEVRPEESGGVRLCVPCCDTIRRDDRVCPRLWAGGGAAGRATAHVFCPHLRVCVTCDPCFERCGPCAVVRGDGVCVRALVRERAARCHVFVDFDLTLCSTKGGARPVPGHHQLDEDLVAAMTLAARAPGGGNVVAVVTRNRHREAIERFLRETDAALVAVRVVSVAGKTAKRAVVLRLMEQAEAQGRPAIFVDDDAREHAAIEPGDNVWRVLFQ